MRLLALTNVTSGEKFCLYASARSIDNAITGEKHRLAYKRRPYARNDDYPTGKLFIANEWCDAQSGKRFDVVNPSTETKLTDVSEGDKADID